MCFFPVRVLTCGHLERVSGTLFFCPLAERFYMSCLPAHQTAAARGRKFSGRRCAGCAAAMAGVLRQLVRDASGGKIGPATGEEAETAAGPSNGGLEVDGEDSWEMVMAWETGESLARVSLLLSRLRSLLGPGTTSVESRDADVEIVGGMPKALHRLRMRIRSRHELFTARVEGKAPYVESRAVPLKENVHSQSHDNPRSDAMQQSVGRDNHDTPPYPSPIHHGYLDYSVEACSTSSQPPTLDDDAPYPQSPQRGSTCAGCDTKAIDGPSKYLTRTFTVTTTGRQQSDIILRPLESKTESTSDPITSTDDECAKCKVFRQFNQRSRPPVKRSLAILCRPLLVANVEEILSEEQPDSVLVVENKASPRLRIRIKCDQCGNDLSVF